jgi:hypothetical protein
MKRLAGFPTTEAMLWLVSLNSPPALAVAAPTFEVAVSSATLKGSVYLAGPTRSCLQYGARRVARRSRLGRISRQLRSRDEVLVAVGAHLSGQSRAILVG